MCVLSNFRWFMKLALSLLYMYISVSVCVCVNEVKPKTQGKLKQARRMSKLLAPNLVFVINYLLQLLVLLL